MSRFDVTERKKDDAAETAFRARQKKKDDEVEARLKKKRLAEALKDRADSKAKEEIPEASGSGPTGKQYAREGEEAAYYRSTGGSDSGRSRVSSAGSSGGRPFRMDSFPSSPTTRSPPRH